MEKRGRPSESSKLIRLVTPPRHQVIPPKSLSKPARTIFEDIVGSVDYRHFVRGDTELLVTLANTTWALRNLAKLIARDPEMTILQKWEKLTRLQMSLCTKLRITPQSRYDSKTAGRRAAAGESEQEIDGVGE